MARILLALVIAPAFLEHHAAAEPQSAVRPLGDQIEWVEHYISRYMPAFDYPRAIAVDASGNVHVTGGSEGPDYLPDITTIQYSRTGQAQWVRRLDGPGDSWDQGQAIAVDQSGNVYVTGYTYSASTSFDYATIKYDSSGTEQWVASFDGSSSGLDHAVALAVDAAGNVYVAGYSDSSGASSDYATIKYDGSGNELWVALFNGPGNTTDLASALALDASGNVYVTGSSGEGSPNLSDYVTVKYDPSGAQQWVGRYDDQYDYAAAIAVDSSANVYVTGRSVHDGAFYDYVTVKYDATGARQWVARYDGPAGTDDFAHSVRVDGSGNVFVTGESAGIGSDADYATIKYTAAGTEQWVRRYDGPGNTVDRAVALAIDASGNVYVTGESRAADLREDFATIEYNTLGDALRVVRYGGTGGVYAHATAIAVDPQGGACVTGISSQLDTSVYTTIKLRD